MTTDTNVRCMAEHRSRSVFQYASGALLLASLALIAACGDSSGGTNPDTGGDTDIDYPNPDGIPYGEECTESDDCSTAFCTTVSPNSPDAFCSVRCAEDADCPQDEPSQCIFVQREGRLSQVCAPNDLCIDRDNDGYGTGPGCIAADCDDNNAAIYPGAPEICDGLDNNCDDLIDVGTIDAGKPCDTGNLGVCATGQTVCQGGELRCDSLVIPGERREICDGLDNDCDGKIDEGPTLPGDDDYDPFDQNYIAELGRSCGDEGGDGCFSGVFRCDSVAGRLYCDGDINPRDEPDLCDYVDNNCDGQVDEDYAELFPDYRTPCEVGIGRCRAIGTWGCHPTDPAAPPVCTASPNMDNALPETCNYHDDNCDGQIDEDFVDANGVYNTVEHCNFCNTSCTATWSPSPEAHNVIPTCNVSGQNASCGFTCLPGFVDFDGRSLNGCEFEPDLQAIYVASAERGGEDTANCGSYDQPCLNIAHAITRANSTSAVRVRVGEGTFQGGFTLEHRIQILGGHSSQTWERDPEVNMSALRGGAIDGITNYSVRIRNLTGSAGAAELSGFTIEAPDATAQSGNTIGVWLINSDNTVTIQNNTILSGRGGLGAPGSEGQNGPQGAPGQAGHDRVNDQTSCANTNDVVLAGGQGGTNSCGGSNVSGGSGASTTCPTASFSAINANGGKAQPGQGAANTSGQGNAGDSTNHYRYSAPQHDVFGCIVDPSSIITSPTPGIAGGDGSDGVRGNGATDADGDVSNHTWVGQSGNSGAAGASGAGGGGGGSSGGIFQNHPDYPTLYHYGATGGGGGAGGCGATGGNGGSPGGASFGIFLSASSSMGSLPTILGNELHRGQGGRGGQGGIGGVGGSGGAPGAGGQQSVSAYWSRCGQHAADGGAGGRGGHGGGGGGGAGGIAYDIAISGYSATSIDPSNVSTIPASIQTGGAAGAGGGGIINPGSSGVAGRSGRLITF